jgi:hypothetical protein
MFAIKKGRNLIGNGVKEKILINNSVLNQEGSNNIPDIQPILLIIILL